MIGSLAVVLLVSIAVGVRKQLLSSVEELGVNTLIVVPGKVGDGMGFNPNLAGTSFLTEAQAKRLRTIPGVQRAAPLIFAGGGIKVGTKESFPLVVATTADWFQIKPNEYKFGGPYTDPMTTEAVALIGSVASKELFGEANPVGRTILVSDKPYRIVGVTKDAESEQSLFSMFGLQNVVYIPFHQYTQGTPSFQVQRLMIQADPSAEPTQLIKQINKELLKDMSDQQFSVLTNDQLQKLIYKFMSILTWLVTGLTSIALLVGGFGISAVMLMSVGERTSEIGIRKTVGATNVAIFKHFFTEALLLALLGAAAGSILASIAVSLIYRFTPVKPIITPAIIILAFGMCLLVGVGAGLLPAIRAARREPVDALRAQ